MQKSTVATPKKETVYLYAGEPGSFIPGLPQRLTKSEASALGVLEQLEAAIAAGKYHPVQEA